MALPNDVSTATLTFGPYGDAEGLAALVASGGKLFPVDPLTDKPINVIHVASGMVIVPTPVAVTIGSDGTGSVGPLPHTDNPGLSPVGFAYRVEWNIASKRPSPGNKTFAVPTAAGATVDFDLLDVAEAVPGVLVPVTYGRSAYDLAVIEGFVGTEAEWLASLKGDAGDPSVTPEAVAANLPARLSDEALRAASVAAVAESGDFTPTGDLRAFAVFMPENYGAVGDGVADDTAAVQAAMDAAAVVKGTVYVPEAVYLVDGLVGRGGVTMRGTGNGSVLRHTATGSNFLLHVNQGTSDASPDPEDNEVGLRFADLRFEGRTDGMYEFYALLDLHAVTDVRVERCSFYGWKGDAIYLGSSRSGGVERHNRLVWITDNVFDGVNNLNRNGVSVIDGDGVWIERNHFQNITVPSQPGAICIEPNSPTFSVARNIWVRSNHFRNITGGVGVVTIALRSQAGLTTPSQGFWVVDNTFDGATGVTQIRANVTDATLAPVDADDTTVPHALTVRGNKVFGGGRAFHLYGLRGIDWADNYVQGTENSAIVGNLPVGRVVDMMVRDNTFRQNAKVDANGGVTIVANKVSRLTIKENVFDDCGRANGTLGVILTLGQNGASSAVSMRRNTIFGPRTTQSISVSSGHVTTPYNNDYSENRDPTPNGAATTFGTAWARRGEPRTVDYDANMTTASIGGANEARIMRVKGEGLIGRIGLSITTQSGNISVGVYQHNGQPGKLNRPTDLVATSGSVACPAVGSYTEVPLDKAVYVREGDYIAISCDNTTAQFAAANVGTASQSAMWDGHAYVMPSAFPLPVTATGLLPQNHRIPSLRGAR